MRTASFAERTRLRQGIGVVRPGGARPPREMMASFIDEHRGRYGVGPIPAFAGMTGAQLPIAPSTYYEHKVREGQPERGPARVRRDGRRCGEIRRVYDEHFGVHGVRKVWRQLRGEGVSVARCTPAPEPHRGVARRMRRLGLRDAQRRHTRDRLIPLIYKIFHFCGRRFRRGGVKSAKTPLEPTPNPGTTPPPWGKKYFASLSTLPISIAYEQRPGLCDGPRGGRVAEPRGSGIFRRRPVRRRSLAGRSITPSAPTTQP